MTKFNTYLEATLNKKKIKPVKTSIVQILQQNGFKREDYERKSGGRSYWLIYQNSESRSVVKKVLKEILTKNKIKFSVGKYSPEEIYAADGSFEIHIQGGGTIYIIVYFGNKYADMMREGIDVPEEY